MKPGDKISRDEIADRLFDGLAPPATPPKLRRRVLAAARAEAGREPAVDVWTRIWESRWLRGAWATSVVALVLGHVALGPDQPSPPAVTVGLHADDEITEYLRVVRIEASASPNVGRAADATDRLHTPDGGHAR